VRIVKAGQPVRRTGTMPDLGVTASARRRDKRRDQPAHQ